jgi:hypothetical protein
LWKDPDRRAAAVQMAENAATNPPPASGKPVTDAELKAQVDKTATSLRSLPIGWSCPANPQTAASTTTPAEGMTLKEIAKQYWDCAREQKQKLSLLQILGWLLTAAALSLGAPFWFDLLNQIINLRGAGTKPQRADANN